MPDSFPDSLLPDSLPDGLPESCSTADEPSKEVDSAAVLNEWQAVARAKLTDPALLYHSLRRALKRRQGFGILFLQCTPAKGEELFAQLQKDLPEKNLGQITVNETTQTLLRQVAAQKNITELNVLFIFGMDDVLAPYLDQLECQSNQPLTQGKNEINDLARSNLTNLDLDWLAVLPPILNHLNLKRENFLERFPHLCFVYVVSPLSLRFFMHRAADYFAWQSGVWRFP